MQRLGWVFPLVLVAACGGGHSDGDPDGDPPDQCNAMFALTCERAVECGLLDDTEDCRDMIDDALGGIECGDIDSVSADYPTCMDSLETSACADLFPDTLDLPPECEGVLQLE